MLPCAALAPGAAQAGAQHRVVIEAMQFSPQTVEVHAGDTIVWSNADPFPHTVSAEARAFDSGEIPAEGNWQMTATRKGVFPYRCALHPSMRGVLLVK
jgi:plastocyanin